MLLGMPRVLLVDDDPAMLRLLEVNFRLEGFETATASHGEEALESIRADRPDAVVLDVMLPGIDGLEVHRRMRADPTLTSVPVVFLTARAFNEEAFEGEVFMSKPFDPGALIGLVRERMEDR